MGRPWAAEGRCPHPPTHARRPHLVWCCWRKSTSCSPALPPHHRPRAFYLHLQGTSQPWMRKGGLACHPKHDCCAGQLAYMQAEQRRERSSVRRTYSTTPQCTVARATLVDAPGACMPTCMPLPRRSPPARRCTAFTAGALLSLASPGRGCRSVQQGGLRHCLGRTHQLPGPVRSPDCGQKRVCGTADLALHARRGCFGRLIDALRAGAFGARPQGRRGCRDAPTGRR